MSACDGGYIDHGFEMVRQFGIPAEADYPYTAVWYEGATFPETEGICEAEQRVKTKTALANKMHRRVDSAELRSMLELGPVGATFTIKEEMLGY